MVSKNSFAQGCSDAGFCTLGAMRPNQPFSRTAPIQLISTELSAYNAGTKFGDHIQNLGIDFNFLIKQKHGLQVKTNYNWVQGPLAETKGLGDLSLSYTRSISLDEGKRLSLTLGGKIPSGKPNKTSSDGRPLPMYYQSTLGTYDLIAGISYSNGAWLVASAIQHPLNKVENRFKWGAWKGSENETKAREYPVSDKLYRGTDAMLRVERNFRSSRWNGYLGLLGIYRISPDRITLPATGLRTNVSSSNGLVLNVIAGAGYRINPHHGLKILGGYAPLKRKTNPDGLSREWVATFYYEYRF